MQNIDINRDIVSFGINKAVFHVENLEAGFLTRICKNNFSKEQILQFEYELSHITNEMANQIIKAKLELSETQYGLLFQYIFDKSVEVCYKMINDLDINTQFHVTEPFDYYEPDLPYNIQQMMTNRVPNIVLISSALRQYIKENGYLEQPLTAWVPSYLMSAACIGMMFAQEIDFNDETELNDFLYSED
jgi:hypothetical protein